MTIAYIIDQYPSYSETFISNEICALRERGINIVILALKKGPSVNDLEKKQPNQIIYLKSIFSPFNLWAHIFFLFADSHKYLDTFKIAINDTTFFTPVFFKAIKRFSTAIQFSYQLRSVNCDGLHAHFISLPASIARLMSVLSGLSFSCTAHANDIYTTPHTELLTKLNQASFVITCTKYNQAYLQRVLNEQQPVKIQHIYHGINLDEWPAKAFKIQSPKYPVNILTVGRLVEKKGISYLLQALVTLKQKGIAFKCDIFGDGPYYDKLKSFIATNNLETCTFLHGAANQYTLRTYYQHADIFILPAIIASDGDMDGLPNVLLEAMATGIPIITTKISAITELITHNITGVLLAQKCPSSIAKAVEQLIGDHVYAHKLIKNGLEKIKAFDSRQSTHQLTKLFKFHYAAEV